MKQTSTPFTVCQCKWLQEGYGETVNLDVLFLLVVLFSRLDMDELWLGLGKGQSIREACAYLLFTNSVM